MMENKEQLIDIYDIWYEPFWKQSWFYSLIIACIFLLGVFCIYFLYKKYIQKSVVIDCAAIAYRDLNTLKKIHIATKQDSKDCYFSLSSIIKRYLACRYDIIFTQLTDAEIVQHAQLYMSHEQVSMLQQILHNMMFVRFEHEVAATIKLEQDMQLIQDFIQNTNPQHDTKEN